MTTITKIKTHDGALFDNEQYARRHLEEKRGALLTKITREIAKDQKYMAILSALDNSIEDMRAIIRITDDLILENEGSEE